MNPKIICLEGLPRTGKTTFFNKIDFEKVPEYYSFLNSENINKLDSNNFEINQKIFLDIELLRKKMISGEIIILDRSVLSNLAFSYALEKISNGNQYIQSKKLHLNYLSKNKIIIPNAFIYFKTNNLPEIKKRIKNSGFNDVWLKKDFLENINYFYDFYFSKLCNVPVFEFSEDLDFEKLIKSNYPNKDEGIYKLLKGEYL